MGHTPGPWDFAGGDMTVHANRLALEICRHIGGHAEAYSNDQEEERIANARLIAAAPELLAALRFVLPVLERAACRGTIDAEGVNLELEAAREVQDAIAKAEGRGE